MDPNARINRPVRALGLCSGGLDSILAALVLRDQGIQVAWICFETPFFGADRARRAAHQTGIELIVRSITPIYLEMLCDPPCGYGRHMNPCMDCHALMFRLAGDIMEMEGFDFLFSGEVLGQRPMSQTRNALRYVEKQSGRAGLILRPLSARCLPETLPEQQGLVDRDRLLDFSGRARKAQIALAAERGIVDYPAPAGGCLLTDGGYSARLRDLFAHQSDFSERELHLLKYGRHLRLGPQVKAVVGRTQVDNENIEKYVDPQCDILLRMASFPGPLTVLPGGGPTETVTLAAAICAGYSKAPADRPATVRIDAPSGAETCQVLPLPPTETHRFPHLSFSLLDNLVWSGQTMF